MAASKSTKTTISLTMKQAEKCREILIADGEPGHVSGTNLLKIFKELEMLRNYKHKQQVKKKKKEAEVKQNKQSKKAAKQNQLKEIPETEKYKIAHWKQWQLQIQEIVAIARTVYKAFIFSGKEHHYQAALEAELRECGHLVQQEVARLLHYEKKKW